MRGFALELDLVTVLEVSEVVGADAQLSLAPRAPAVHVQGLGQSNVVTGTACDIYNDMIDETFDEPWINGNPALHLLALLAIAVVLAPLVHSALLGEAQSMISTTFNLCHVQFLCEERWTSYELGPRVHSKLTMSVVSPSVSITDTLLCHIHHHAKILALFSRLLSLRFW